MTTPSRHVVAALTAALLAGCTTFAPDGGFAPVGRLTQERTGQTPQYQRDEAQVDGARRRVAELLSTPLTADRAVELAFLSNRGLQAGFSELGIAEAELVRAGRLRNPVFNASRLRDGGGVVDFERSLMFDVLGLVTLPVAAEAQGRRFAQTQLQAADQAVTLAADVRVAYFQAVAAQELLVYAGQVKEAADAANELALRMKAAGNFSKLAQMREQTFFAEASVRWMRAQQQALAHRERLTRLLGLSGEQVRFKLPDRLPDLPVAPSAPQSTEQTAIDRRLDILMARRAADDTAKALGLTRTTRFINVLELGYKGKSTTGASHAHGVEVELELPLFDFGTTRLARAEALYMQALHRVAEVAVKAQSEVRESHAAYALSHELARHARDEVVPLSQRISQETMLRYNGMLISVFDLLGDARAQITAVTGSVEALRDFWIADTQLQAALAGRTPTGATTPSTSDAAPSNGDTH